MKREINMNKIILIFGTFNPLTMAHIQIGILSEREINADKVIYVPAKDNFLTDWKKMDYQTILSAEKRIYLMQEAFASYGFEVSDVEITNESDGKTYNTIKLLKEKYPNSLFWLVMGADKLKELDKWYNADKLLKENKFLIVSRDHKTFADETNVFIEKYKDNFQSITNNKYTEISSSMIREACINGNISLYKDYLPKVVYDYLIENNIYGKGDKNV